MRFAAGFVSSRHLPAKLHVQKQEANAPYVWYLYIQWDGDGMNFVYGETQIHYLAGKDKRLGQAMEQIGYIECAVDPDLFASTVRQIVGQQISMAAQHTIWQRMQQGLGIVSPETIAALTIDGLQRFGMTYKKAGYIHAFAQKVLRGTFDIEALWEKDDQAVIEALSSLDGVGAWTAEMLMIFSMQRQNILSYGDLAIHRGMRMLYHHRKVDKKRFELYRRRYSPYGTVASLYLWAIATGAIPGMKDDAKSGKTK